MKPAKHHVEFIGQQVYIQNLMSAMDMSLRIRTIQEIRFPIEDQIVQICGNTWAQITSLPNEAN